MLSEGHGILEDSVREAALGIKLKVIDMQEFGGFSNDNVIELVDYLKQIKSLAEVKYQKKIVILLLKLLK